MQRLALADRFFPALFVGEKTQTIRWQEGEVRPGPLLFFSEHRTDLQAVVLVTRSTRMPLRDVAAFLGKTKEWPDDEMLSGMQRHYPTITLDTTVDVVEHLSPAASRRSAEA